MLETFIIIVPFILFITFVLLVIYFFLQQKKKAKITLSIFLFLVGFEWITLYHPEWIDGSRNIHNQLSSNRLIEIEETEQKQGKNIDKYILQLLNYQKNKMGTKSLDSIHSPKNVFSNEQIELIESSLKSNLINFKKYNISKLENVELKYVKKLNPEIYNNIFLIFNKSGVLILDYYFDVKSSCMYLNKTYEYKFKTSKDYFYKDFEDWTVSKKLKYKTKAEILFYDNFRLEESNGVFQRDLNLPKMKINGKIYEGYKLKSNGSIYQFEVKQRICL